ncbi:hypothetical protein SELMODRAFT_420076 [Selaginella moellendorffii]|uniref:dCMP deaminase n=1 Tax=Selaginella moellendorffii TaxID=88036 RepID=D8SAG7_SELML|nr:hypothetical protein SELMODRAFT_420076 [Selaginella moellendorffii]
MSSWALATTAFLEVAPTISFPGPKYVCHAEVNAILNRNHASASGQRLYVTMFPCNECAKVIIQAGIAEVIFYTDKQSHPNFQFTASRKLLSMANVKLRQHQPKAKSIIL